MIDVYKRYVGDMFAFCGIWPLGYSSLYDGVFVGEECVACRAAPLDDAKQASEDETCNRIVIRNFSGGEWHWTRENS